MRDRLNELLTPKAQEAPQKQLTLQRFTEVEHSMFLRTLFHVEVNVFWHESETLRIQVAAVGQDDARYPALLPRDEVQEFPFATRSKECVVVSIAPPKPH